MIDRVAVRRHFSRAATSYDAAAVLQQEVAQRLASRLPLFKLSPQRMLDVGAGTGFLSQHLQQYFRSADLFSLDLSHAMLQQLQQKMATPWWQQWNPFHAPSLVQTVVADSYQLPIADARIDLVASSLMLQWCDDLPAVLSEWRRVMADDGVLFVATLGPDTLKEIRQAWAEVDGQDQHRLLNFTDIHVLGDALGQAGFSNPVLDMEHITLTYANASAAVKDLKAIGATNANRDRQSGLMGKERWRRFLAAYAAQAMPDGRIPATFEVVYAHAWAGQRPQRKENGVVSIPLQKIQRWQPSKV